MSIIVTICIILDIFKSIKNKDCAFRIRDIMYLGAIITIGGIIIIFLFSLFVTLVFGGL